VSAKSAVYRQKKRTELVRLANQILAKFPARRDGFVVNIEGLVEDFDLTLIFRSMRGIPVEAYLARDPNFVVINQEYIHHRERYRFSVAHELAHRVLEFNLLNDGPRRSEEPKPTHELSAQEYRAIERDAMRLASEILQPEQDYRERFAHHQNNLQVQGGSKEALLRATIRAVAHDFRVSVHSTAFRAHVLGFITRKRYDEMFPPIL
jgi:Zn-dependent peptidase ImmA (M78 family)